MRLDKHLDDGFFLAPRFNGEADSSESDESSESDDGGDSAIAVFAFALALFLAGALFFLAPPGFVLLANGEAGDSSESDDGRKASESEEGGGRRHCCLCPCILGIALGWRVLSLIRCRLWAPLSVRGAQPHPL